MELTKVQEFFLISGIAFWFLVFIAILAFIAYLITNRIPEPKSYDVTDRSIGFPFNSEEFEEHKRKLEEFMKRRKEV